MLRLLVVAALYIVVLQAILSYIVPAARAAGLSAFWAGFTFFAVNVTAMIARLVWGRVADRQGGSRRVRTLVETGIVAAIGGLVFTLALHAGAGLVVPAAVLFGFGASFSPAFALIPHALEPLAAVPVGLGLAWLGYSLWSERLEPASQRVPAREHAQRTPTPAA